MMFVFEGDEFREVKVPSSPHPNLFPCFLRVTEHTLEAFLYPGILLPPTNCRTLGKGFSRPHPKGQNQTVDNVSYIRHYSTPMKVPVHHGKRCY